MMQGSTSWTLLLVVVSLLVGWVYWIRKVEERKWKGLASLPSGSFGLPVLGETLGFVKNIDASSLGFFTQPTAKYGEVGTFTSYFASLNTSFLITATDYKAFS